MANPYIFSTYKKVEKGGMSTSTFYRKYTNLDKEMEILLSSTARKIALDMSNYIKTHTKRKGAYNKNSLSQAIKNSITYSVGKNGISVGIGNILSLKKTHPYWKSIDVGGYIPPITGGWFGKGSKPSSEKANANEVWHAQPRGTKGAFVMTPKKVVVGIRYIDYAKKQAKKRMKEVWKLIYGKGIKK